ncbi:hypothetical protein HDV06_000059 [Boothiomyces sp. JEL0866]|nr:hypothetical protein HDV06_000059 [Boothiomyces sp. JEL0866]
MENETQPLIQKPATQRKRAVATALKVILFAVVLLVAGYWYYFTSPIDTSKYTNSKTLKTPSNKEIELYWTVDEKAKEIEFAVVSKNGATWVAIGTSDAGGMKGADIWLGYKKNDEFILEDRFSETYGYPILDQQQDLKLLSWYQSYFSTAFTFKRSLESCDDHDAKLVTSHPMWFVFAVGTSNEFTMHAPGDNAQVYLDLEGHYFDDYVDVPLDDDTVEYSMIAPAYEIPAEDTVYCYSYFDISKDLSEKHQVVVEDISIASKYVHHMVGYLCDEPLLEFETPNTNFCNYYRPVNPVINYSPRCGAIHFAWAKGGVKKTYPANMGKPIGPGDIPVKYLILETHYSNPSLTPGQFDPGSGFKLKITKKLRELDVGVFTLGVPQNYMYLPPGQLASVEGECGSKCTMKEGIPETGLNVLSSQLHMHRRGKAMSTKHIRDGVELSPLPSMEYFDFNYQSYNFVPKDQAKILPGDRLITKCTYDTRKDTEMVVGGWSSEQEMCYAFVEYYPAMPNYSSCLQIPDLEAFPKKAKKSYTMICDAGEHDLDPVIKTGPKVPFVEYQPDSVCNAK